MCDSREIMAAAREAGNINESEVFLRWLGCFFDSSELRRGYFLALIHSALHPLRCLINGELQKVQKKPYTGTFFYSLMSRVTAGEALLHLKYFRALQKVPAWSQESTLNAVFLSCRALGSGQGAYSCIIAVNLDLLSFFKDENRLRSALTAAS